MPTSPRSRAARRPGRRAGGAGVDQAALAAERRGAARATSPRSRRCATTWRRSGRPRATLQSELDALRTEVERDASAELRAEIEAAIAPCSPRLRADLDAERAAREADQAALAALRAELEAAQARLTEAGAPAEGGLLDRVAELDRRAAGLADELAFQRRAREQAEAAAAAVHVPAAESERVVADLDAAASALRERADNGIAAEAAPPRRRREAAPAEAAPVAGRGRARAEAAPPTPSPPPRPPSGARRDDRVRARARPPANHATGRSQRQYPWLRGALVKLAHDDPEAAGRIIAGLLPVQAAIFEGPVDYDLTIAEAGTYRRHRRGRPRVREARSTRRAGAARPSSTSPPTRSRSPS